MDGKRASLANLLYHLIRVKKIEKAELAKTLEVSEDTINGWFDGSLAMTEDQEKKVNFYIGKIADESPDFKKLVETVADEMTKREKELRHNRGKAQKEKSQ
jgi:plasmid maintenance system antidote protein VapI